MSTLYLIRLKMSVNEIVCAASSDVFKAMFYGELKENADIRVTDVSHAAFKQFLQFFVSSQK